MAQVMQMIFAGDPIIAKDGELPFDGFGRKFERSCARLCALLSVDIECLQQGFAVSVVLA